MDKQQLLYEGKAKKVYATADPDLLVVEYKDDATAFNGLKRGQIADKGLMNNQIAAHFFRVLAGNGVPSHFVRVLSGREMLVKRLSILPVEVVVRYIAAGSLSKRLGLAEGTPLPSPVLEFYYKKDELGDPLVNEYHIRVLGLAAPQQVAEISGQALQVGKLLTAYLREKAIVLVDFKLEFGLFHGQVLLGDEISPDTCRFWDAVSGEKLDKDRFRRDLGGVGEAYAEVLRRLTGGEPERNVESNN
ncbi:MAG: Phosphoribosylaminoimidazole-succinocarboxamide synthase [Syntrophomonadaceae bacterium]|nr:Phosphoribosylaminoimidazole-succinocarboxamide synthase [Bacillota bacterium]